VSQLVELSSPVRLGTASAPLRFAEGEHPPGGWRGRRYLTLDHQNAFELSFWCGTCPFLFERLPGANHTLSSDELTTRRIKGLPAADATVIELASQLVQDGEYLPLLVEVTPQLVYPAGEGDYFADEQVRTWGVDSFWGLPGYPRTPYYRAGTRPMANSACLFEFVVPMVPPSWNNPDTVTQYAQRRGGRPPLACLSVSILDICQPAVAADSASEPGLAHWCLAHFLLDGHHKMQAASQTGQPVRLLALLSIDNSLAQRDDILSVPGILDHR
jgi:hypothetical protein